MKYFLLAKSGADNQLVALNKQEVHILPQINLTYYATHGLFEQSLIDWFAQFCRKDKVFLDLGAHSGTYSVSLAKHCKEVHSFEPQRMTYYSLCGSVALSHLENVYCHKVAIGSPAQVGKQNLNIVSVDGGGSSLQGAPTIGTEIVDVLTLDSFAIRDVGCIKMDIEGNELEALKGAVNTLRWSNYPPILFESNTEHKELFAYIKSMGYSIVPINGYANMFLAASSRT